MKKIIFTLALASLALAGTQDYKNKVAKLISQKTQQAISVKEVIDLDGSKDLKVLILEDKQNDQKIAVLASQDGNVVVGLSQVFISKSEKDLMILSQAYQSTQPKIIPPKPEVLNKLFSSIPPSRLISLSSTAKTPQKTYYIVSDPRCPACRKELAEVEKKLKDGDVKILLVSFLGQESAYKAKLIYDKVAKLKDNASKLKVMRQIYDPSYELSPKDKKQDITTIEKNTQEVTEAGIKSIPFEHIIKH